MQALLFIVDTLWSLYLGVYLVRITPEAMFYKITNWTVFLIGCELTRQGLMDLLR